MPVLTYRNAGTGTTTPGTPDVEDLGSVDREWRRLFLGDQADALRLGIAQDVNLGRGAADRLDLATGDSLRVVNGDVSPGSDGVGNLGTALLRWLAIRGVSITAGDFVFENDWRLTEAENLGLEPGIAVVKPNGEVAHVWR